MSIIGKIFMFLSSYSPLYLFIITLNYKISDMKESIIKIFNFRINEIVKADIILYILIVIIIFSNLILYRFINISKKYSDPVQIVSIENANEKVLDYILAYIVSFITTDFVQIADSDCKVLTTAILIQLLLGYLYCKGNMFYINPILNFSGYEIYSIQTPNNKIILLTKNKENLKNLINDLNKEKIRNSSANEVTITRELNYFSNEIYILK